MCSLKAYTSSLGLREFWGDEGTSHTCGSETLQRPQEDHHSARCRFQSSEASVPVSCTLSALQKVT